MMIQQVVRLFARSGLPRLHWWCMASRRRPSSSGARRRKPVTIEVLDVGQGDSILIRSPEGKTAPDRRRPHRTGAVRALKRAGNQIARLGGRSVITTATTTAAWMKW